MRVLNEQKVILEEIKFRGKSQEYFFHEVYPRFNEVDSYKVVWNGHFINYFELARTELCRQLGITLEKLANMGVFLPVYKYEMVLRKSVFLDDKMRVGVRLVNTSEGCIEFDHILLVNDEVRVLGKVQQVVMSKETGQMAFQVPQEVMQALKPIYEVFYGTDGTIKKSRELKVQG